MYSILLHSLLPFVLSSSDFWITSKVLNVEWKEDCLTTRECSRPIFEIAHEFKPADLRFTQSVTVSERIVQDSSPFVSSWSTGSTEEISISAFVMGVDPVYSFPRVCDSTTATRPFLPGDISSRFRRVSMSEGDVKSIQVSGRCFTATIEVKRHNERCPWCPEEVIVEKKEVEENGGFVDDKIVLIAMAAIILILLITLITLVIICLCCKKSNESTAPSNVFTSSHTSNSSAGSMTSSGIFSISGSSINTTVTIHGSPIENDYDSIKGDLPVPSNDSGFPV